MVSMTLIIVDAYSSDAIPIHLATEEAMGIYKESWRRQGAVAMHVSTGIWNCPASSSALPTPTT